MIKFIHCNGRFTEDFEQTEEERKIFEIIGKSDEGEITHTWIPLSIKVEEIIAFNAFDEYTCVVRLANTQSFVIDLLYGEVLYLLMPWHFRAYYTTIERIKDWFKKIKVLNR